MKFDKKKEREIEDPARSYVSIRVHECTCCQSVGWLLTVCLPCRWELDFSFLTQLSEGTSTTPPVLCCEDVHVHSTSSPPTISTSWRIKPGRAAILDECPSTELTSTSGRLSRLTPRKQVLPVFSVYGVYVLTVYRTCQGKPTSGKNAGRTLRLAYLRR